MATIANWNGHTFEVSPNLIRGFTDFSIKGSCETTTKNSNKQKYEERKYGESPEVNMTVGLSALLGVTDVFSEALELVSEAQAGATAYFYMGTRKLVPAKLMLKSAEVAEVVCMPGDGEKWISCNVKVTFKQGTKDDSGSRSGSSSGGSGGSKKASVKTSGTTAANAYDVAKTVIGEKAVNAALNAAKSTTTTAKNASSEKKSSNGVGGIKSALNKQTKTEPVSYLKTTATTGKKATATSKKVSSSSSIAGRTTSAMY